MGSVTPWNVGSHFPDQGLNRSPLHCKPYSQPLDPPGKSQGWMLKSWPNSNFFFFPLFLGSWVGAVWRQSDEAYEPHLIIMLLIPIKIRGDQLYWESVLRFSGLEYSCGLTGSEINFVSLVRFKVILGQHLPFLFFLKLPFLSASTSLPKYIV